jgi:hypothetical protein
MNTQLKLGFTGTQQGMTFRQYESFPNLMDVLSRMTNEYHHGDCQGADDQFHSWIVMYDNRPIKIVSHPLDNPYKRAYCTFSGNFEIRPQKPYLDRNLDIVSETDLLIATPKEYVEVVRSRTWATIRYARKQKKPIYIIYPDGGIIKNGI